MIAEDLLAIKTWGELSFDVTGSRLYFVEQALDAASNRNTSRLMLAELEGLEVGAVRPLTYGPDDHHPRPSPDGRGVGFISRRSGSSQLWWLPGGGGEAVQWSHIQGGVRDFVWSPTSEQVALVVHLEGGLLEPEAGGPVAVPTDDRGRYVYYNRDVKHIVRQYYKLDGTGFFDQGRNQMVLLEAASGQVRLLTSGFDDYAEPVFSRDGTTLFMLHQASDHPGSHPGIREIEALNIATGGRRHLTANGLLVSSLRLGGDGKSLLYIAHDPADHGYGHARLHRLSLQDGTSLELSRFDRSIGDDSMTDVPPPSSGAPGDTPEGALMLWSSEGRVGLGLFPNQGAVVPVLSGDRVIYDFVHRAGRVAFALADPTHPSGIALAFMDGEEGSVHWAPFPDAVAPVEAQEFWATESDGTRVQGFVMAPPKGTGPYPVVLEIHGGPMGMYGFRYHHEFQWLVSKGYAVVFTNPRGSLGFGETFLSAIMGQWGDLDFRDVMAGLDEALAQNPNLDSTRLGVAGGSYGGFMVNWILSHSDRFRAGVTMRSVVNRLSAMGSSDLGWLRVPQYGTKPWWEDPEPYWQQSPLKYVSQIKTPLLIEHQEEDYRLPVEQGEQLFAALKYLGRTVEMMLYPGESHGMSRSGKPWHRVYRLNALAAWYAKYL